MMSFADAPSFRVAKILLRLSMSNAACVDAAPFPGTSAASASANVFGTHEAIATPTSPVFGSTPTTDQVIMLSVSPTARTRCCAAEAANGSAVRMTRYAVRRIAKAPGKAGSMATEDPRSTYVAQSAGYVMRRMPRLGARSHRSPSLDDIDHSSLGGNTDAPQQSLDLRSSRPRNDLRRLCTLC